MDWNKFNKQLRNVVDTGKVVLGTKQSIKECLVGEPKMVILSKTIKKIDKDILEYYCKLLEIEAVEYPESGFELASVCGKPFSISSIIVKDFGESSIIDVMNEKDTESKVNTVRAKKEKKQKKKDAKEKLKKVKALKKKEKEERPIEEDEMFKAIVRIKKK